MHHLIYYATTWVIPLLLCIIVHEVSHGWMALKLGDPTAKFQGRLTLNPQKHIDLIGTILLPLFLLLTQTSFLFGWAKPVPVDYRNLKKPKRDMGLVALAGPLSNILLAIIFMILLKITLILFSSTFLGDWLIKNFSNGIELSLVLAVFNLLPVLPLDGGRIVASILPYKYSIKYMQTERYGLIVLLVLVFILPPLFGINIISWFINTLYPFLYSIVQLFS